nr:T9SS type A sorting domain-containing protein [Bacteroidota bacterium]
MKKINLLSRIMLVVIFISVASSVKCQWSLPQPFTTSTSDKANACLNHIYCYNDDLDLLFWEQSTDSGSTSIWYKKYLTGEDPIEVIHDPGMHYKNPKILTIGYQDTIFYLFFEKNHNNERDIYYMKFASDGGHSDPISFDTSGSNNRKYEIVNDGINSNFVVWLSDNYLLASFLEHQNGVFQFLPPDTIDSGNISEIAISWRRIVWINEADNLDQLMEAVTELSGDWSDPVEIISHEKISNLESSMEYYNVPLITWAYLEEGTWKVNNCYFSFPQYTFYPFEIFNLDFNDFGVLCSNLYPEVGIENLGYYDLAFPKDTSGNTEIFVYNNFYSPEPIRLSYLYTECRNPRFYFGALDFTYNGGQWVYLVWEAFVDGYWQLYYSRLLFLFGSVNENTLAKDIQIYPNPASDFIRIENSKELNLTIRLFDVTGKLVFEDRFADKDFSVVASILDEGIYFVRIDEGENHLTEKIIVH